MRITEDREAVLPADNGTTPKAWQPITIKGPASYSVSLEEKVSANDKASIQAVYDGLNNSFPIEVKGQSGLSSMRSDVYYSKGFDELAQCTSSGYWVLISTGSIDFLRATCASFVTNPECRAVLKLDDFPREIGSAINLIVLETALNMAIEYQIMHEVGHVIAGHTMFRRNLQSDPMLSARFGEPASRAMELQADFFASERLCEMIMSKQSSFGLLPKEAKGMTDHMALTLGLLGLTLVFAGYSNANRVLPIGYPPIIVRALNAYEALCEDYSKRSQSDLSMEEIRGTVSLAVDAVLPALSSSEFGACKQVAQEFSIFSRQYRGNGIDGVFGKLDAEFANYDRSRGLWSQYALRRAKHNFWDANW